jgi:conjugative relaxase-like TrwC/TraI family protein
MKLTKSNGDYFSSLERVWQETFDQLYLPFWVGRFEDRVKIFNNEKTGQPGILQSQPGPIIIRDLMNGHYMDRVQKNRVGCFDQTFTLSKSVSILFYGLSHPSNWHNSAKIIEAKSRPIVEDYLKRLTIRQQAGGKVKVPAVGCAIGFVHYKSNYGDPHGHVHYAIPNMAITKNGVVGSIGNMREIMLESGLHRAMFQKGIDEELQQRGFKTIRKGNYVEVAGIPKRMIEELSTGRRIIESLKGSKGFDSAKAHDFYAREARRISQHLDATPEKMHERTIRLASQFNVNLDKLRQMNSEPPKNATAASRSVAHDVAKEALQETVKQFGTFSREQYLERVYTLGIGRKTTSQDLQYMGEAFLKKQMKVEQTREGLGEKQKSPQSPAKQKQPDPTRISANKFQKEKQKSKPKFRRPPRYATGMSRKVLEETLKKYGFVRDTAGQQRPNPDTVASQKASHQKNELKDAWNELKLSSKDFGKSVFIRTTRKARNVLNRLSRLFDPLPNIKHLNTFEAEKLAKSHLPTPYLKAHGKAIVRGLFSSGNPIERVEFAEKAYRQLRSYERLPRNTILVIDQKVMNSPRLLHQIAKIAKRDKASLIMTRVNAPHLQSSRRISSSRFMGREYGGE